MYRQYWLGTLDYIACLPISVIQDALVLLVLHAYEHHRRL